MIACAFCTAKVPARNEDDQEQDALNATDSAEARSMGELLSLERIL